MAKSNVFREKMLKKVGLFGLNATTYNFHTTCTVYVYSVRVQCTLIMHVNLPQNVTMNSVCVKRYWLAIHCKLVVIQTISGGSHLTHSIQTGNTKKKFFMNLYRLLKLPQPSISLGTLDLKQFYFIYMQLIEGTLPVKCFNVLDLICIFPFQCLQ